MKRGELVTGIVERVEFPCKGVVRVDEENTVTVKGVIPGQTIEARVKKVHGGKGEGMLLNVVKPADNEIVPTCPHFGECGGCSYRNLEYSDQLVLKENQVQSLLRRILDSQGAPYEWLGIKGSPVNAGYRNKMEFTFGDEYRDGPLALGMHKKGSFYDVVSVTECEIVDEDYRLILSETLDFFRGRNVSYYHRMRHQGFLRHLLVRKACYTGEILVALVTTTQMDSAEMDKLVTEYCDMLLKLKLKGKITGVLHTKNDALADIVQSDETVALYGRDYITEKMLGLQFNISEFSFFQTNTRGAELLYTTAREFIGELGEGSKVVYDLYSGTGTIAQMIAPVAKKVIGVEIVEEAVMAAIDNARLNGLDNCEFIAGDVLEVLDRIVEKPDFIILDPPRDGIHPKAIRKIIDYGVDRLIYISCKPTSLSRDLAIFIANGYVATKVVAVDQFPGTSHVETICLLSRETGQHAKDYIKVGIDAEEYYQIKNESK